MKKSGTRRLSTGCTAILAAVLVIFSSRGLAAEPVRRVAAYYFHTTIRCTTCLLIEERAGRVFSEAFAGEIADGLLNWQPVNLQEPENRHYLTELRARPKSLTLVEYYNEVPTERKELPGVWSLVYGEPEVFRRYLEEEVRSFLDGTED